MKKLFTLLTLVLALALSMSTFAACGDDKKGEEGTSSDTTTSEDETVSAGWTTFEAEGIDFAGLSAPGPSNSYSETQMIFGKNTPSYYSEKILKSISGGYAVGAMTSSANILKFVIKSDKVATGCKMKIRMAIENGDKFENGVMPLNKDIMSVKVNGTALDYDTININGGTEAGFKTIYKDFDISVAFDLVEGENTIELQVVPNKTAQYVTTAGADGGAPSIDCIKVKSTSTLTWDSLWDLNKQDLGIN